MRLLCLHGLGNSQIFKAQTGRYIVTIHDPQSTNQFINEHPIQAAIRYELGDSHDYEFVEGCVPWSMAPETKPHHPTTSLSPTTTFTYYNPTSPPSIHRALTDLQSYLETEGPFDGLIGFSIGASLAASFIAHKPAAELPVKCAILISPAPPVCPLALNQGEGDIRVLDPLVDGEVIEIPTAVVWGSEDGFLEAYGGGSVVGLCRRGKVVEYVHGGGHEVPGSGGVGGLSGTVKMIRRVIDMVRREEEEGEEVDG
ncbi:hypothetical protein FQN50_000165 [Emmonsiellopsis sp. PD_5]|nr:hypothetical protein FQN50_000165 [Emmonsiellopsis sp. PD_5]